MTNVLSRTNPAHESDVSRDYIDETIEKVFTEERTSRVGYSAMYRFVVVSDLKDRYDPPIERIDQLQQMSAKDIRDGVLSRVSVEYIEAVLDDIGLSLAT